MLLLLLSDLVSHRSSVHKGPYIKDVRKIFGFLDPLPPLVRKFTQPPLLTSSTMSAFEVPPSPPPGADVLYVWPLMRHVDRGCSYLSRSSGLAPRLLQEKRQRGAI